MVLAIVDDLMFVSKIKAAASSLGVGLTVARSLDDALDKMRQSAPSLVILDLNGTRTDPLATVAAMKRDHALSTIPTIGFVSHVRTDVINAARDSGVDEILARSAFTERLAEILQRDDGSRS
ncbi:MAG: response regulator [Blastocatellia bacterium]|nr:MAG: response regulator [Blastocatellia bacterium]